MSGSHFYFAYGSNLHPMRLEQRVGRCTSSKIGTLSRSALSFSKRGMDGSGKCNIHFTGFDQDTVVGVVYEVTATQSRLLDDWESTTCGYHRIEALVQCGERSVTSFTYKAHDSWTDTTILPFDWYKRLVVLGASHFGFPPEYIERLRMQPAIPDDDKNRCERNAMVIADIQQSRARNESPDANAF